MRGVAKERPVQVAWKLFSLAAANQGREYNAAAHARGQNLERTLVLARRRGGNEAVERLYFSLGEAIHGQRDNIGEPEVIARCLEEAGLPKTLFDEALSDDSTEADLLAEHETAVKERGAFGVPTVALAGANVSVFGPVIEPIPTGKEALDLWDHLQWALASPYFYEFKRERKFKLGPQHAQ